MASLSDRQPVALVTGVAGFTGRHVAGRLTADGYAVCGLSRHGGGGLEVDVDLLDRGGVGEVVAELAPDVVVHLAAISFVAQGDADAIYRVNVVGTRNLLEALAALPRPPRVVVLASSANIYGNASDDPITEQTEPSPANDYAVSKLAMEYMARLWANRLPIVVTRPFNYTGVGQGERFLIPKIVAKFRRGEATIELGNLDVWRDFSDVRVIAEAYARIVAAAPVGMAFNLCSGVEHSLRDVLDMMERIAGYRIKVDVNPAFVRANEVVRLVGSNQRLQRVVGPLEAVPLIDTLRWMYSTPG
jgi:nucleoside-diphosphate-sugar epimerase